MTEHPIRLPNFEPVLEGFRVDEFLRLTETLLDMPVEHNQAQLNRAPFRMETPEPLPEPPLPPLPPRWYPRLGPDMVQAARAALTPPARPPLVAGRQDELQRVLRPLLSGHPMRVCGEAGVGKTALLAAIAQHERTRQRFRRIWWIDEPARLEQTLALALELPHVLVERDPFARRAWLAEQKDEHTLLVIDNATRDDPLLDTLATLTPHVLVGIETAPEIPDPDQPLPDDPEGVVTLRVLDDSAAIEALAHFCGLDDVRQLRAQLGQIALALGNHPYALMLAGKLVRRDGLTLDELDVLLALHDFALPDDTGTDADAAADEGEESGDEDDSSDADDVFPDRTASLNRALDVSVEALPRAYQRLFDAFGAFPPEGAPFEGLCATARIGSDLACRRGLLFLAEYGFIRADHRDPERYIMHPVAYARAAQNDPHGEDNALGKRMRAWALRFAREQTLDALALYRAEPALVWAYHHEPHKRHNLGDALRPYLREYAPGALDAGDDGPDAEGPRAEGMHLTSVGIELTDDGALLAAEQALVQALELRREYDSAHGIAEALVALGRLWDHTGRPARAAELLVEAAELVYNLNADESLSVIRRGLARVYRHMDRLNDALGVLDDAPGSRLERGLILRARGEFEAAVREIDAAAEATPYTRAETFLLAGQYAEALAAIADADDPASAHLRAQAYHLQGSVQDAIRGYGMALDRYDSSDPARAKTLRGLGAAYASDGQAEFAQAALAEALAIQRAESQPDPVRLGRTLRLLAAVHFLSGDTDQAAQVAREALDTLEDTAADSDIADAFRTLGRAAWLRGAHVDALEAFTGEIEHAQSDQRRDDTRIGIALHHVADAYRATGSLDRAIANYRRALTHKEPADDPHSFFITQVALHRALLSDKRVAAALDLSQEMVDHLAEHNPADLATFGFAQAIRARTQQAAQRPIRAQQSTHEWAQALAQQAEDATAASNPALRVLVLGLAARTLLATNQPDLVLEIAESSLALAEQHYPNSLPAWAARRDLGAALAGLERHTAAIKTLAPLLVHTLEDEPGTYALAHALTGHAQHALDQPEIALDHLELAFEFEPESHHQGLLQEAMAEIHRTLDEPETAVTCLETAFPLLDRKRHPDVVARVLVTQAEILTGLSRHEDAATTYENALIVLREVGNVDPSHTADVLRALGEVHEAQGQPDEAARAYRRALNG
ncbi:MAG: tetratricopeptide repeat protein, partial [Chloroflexi bacterium]|nr:tetratricopeptide repeat protein [Chloroflexota bacterium]